MVSVRKNVVGGKTYYYLDYSMRVSRKNKKRTIYLGNRIPSDIEKIKEDFLRDINRERWTPIFENIKKNHSKVQKSTPRSAKDKEAETFAIKFTYDTQRIEGSTLSLRETADLLERGTTPNNKPLRDVKEAEAHRSLFHETIMTKRGLSLQTVLNWHWKLLKSTEPDIAGKIRKHQVYIARSNFVPPSPVEVTPMLNEFFEWYNRSKNKINPVELAALVHLKFVTIHPFSNGNGRISRLMMNFVLNRGGYPMFNVPYSGRNSYYNALERSQTKHQDFIFVQWTSKNYVKIHRKLIK